MQKFKCKKGFSKEQISDVVLVLIVVTIISIIILPMFSKQKKIVDSIRTNELENQHKFSIGN